MAGTLTISTLSDGTNSTSATNPIKGSAKAWVNFNGTGTVAIRASYNVSSITDNGTGRYTINFTNAMPDANYSVGGITQNIDEMGIMIDGVYDTSPAVMTASALKIDTARGSTTYDCTTVCIQIFR
jgi:hypothetical protein